MRIFYSTNNWIALAIILILFIVFIIATIRFANFKKGLNYINGEIHRTRGSEREYWKREKKRLIRTFLLFKSLKQF